MVLNKDIYQNKPIFPNSHKIQRNDYQVKQTLALASNFVNNRIDRYLEIASLYQQIHFKWHAVEIYGWIKDLDPQSQQKGLTTYEDYEEIGKKLKKQFFKIVNEYYDEQRLQYASKSIEKLIELSNNKATDLIKIGSRMLMNLLKNLQTNILQEHQNIKNINMITQRDIYYDQHMYQKAIQFYQQACILKPEDFRLHIKYTESKLKLQLYQDTLDQIQKYQQTLDQGQNYILKGINLSENQYETLLILIEKLKGQQVNGILLQKAIDLNGNDLELAISYAQHILITQNVTQQAIDAFKKYMSLDPGDCFYINPLIKVYKELGRIDEAIEFLRQFNLVSKRYNSFLELGELLLNQKQIDEALKYFNQALELDKAQSYNFIVKMLFENQYYDECIKYCNEYNLFDHYSRSSYYYKGKKLQNSQQKKAYSLMKLDKDLQDALDLLKLAQKIQHQYDTQDLVDKIQKRISEQETLKEQEQL